jgi:hypothetical protein
MPPLAPFTLLIASYSIAESGRFAGTYRTSVRSSDGRRRRSFNGARDDTPPVIEINGDNPAICLGDATYSDPGATITGPQADLNLGIETFVNGVSMSPVQVDTSAAATDTIDYMATDQSALTSTSTRTVLVEAGTSSAE